MPEGQNSKLLENLKSTSPVVALLGQRGNCAAKPDRSSAVWQKPYDAESAKTTMPKTFATPNGSVTDVRDGTLANRVQCGACRVEREGMKTLH
jgi:hypothetical protein